MEDIRESVCLCMAVRGGIFFASAPIPQIPYFLTMALISAKCPWFQRQAILFRREIFLYSEVQFQDFCRMWKN